MLLYIRFGELTVLNGTQEFNGLLFEFCGFVAKSGAIRTAGRNVWLLATILATVYYDHGLDEHGFSPYSVVFIVSQAHPAHSRVTSLFVCAYFR